MLPPRKDHAAAQSAALHLSQLLIPMSSLLETITSSLAGPQMGQLAQAIGADENKTQAAVATALPALLTAMNRNAKQSDGANALAGALQKDHDGSLLDNLSGFLSGAVTGRQANGAGILKHVLGNDQSEVEQGIAQSSGLDLSQVAKLLPLLTPIVMAVLGKQQRSGGLNASALANLLGQESKTARQAVPSDLLGSLGGFFDRDGDGDYKDDLLQQAGSAVLGNLFGGKR